MSETKHNSDEAQDVKSKLSKLSTIFNLAKEILVILVIPLILWGVKLEVNDAVNKEKISSVANNLNIKIAACQKNITTVESTMANVNRIVFSNSQKLSALDTKIEGANRRLDDLFKLLLKMSK